MRPSFLIMLAVGLGLMLLFWWKAWEVEEDKVAEDALVTGCASGTPCPAHLPQCQTGFDHISGVCSTSCQADNQCPESWCCPPAADEKSPRLCLPRQGCLKLKDK